MAVTPYSQRDIRWAGLKLGTGQTTIGQEGCLITCVASAATDIGAPITPADLNNWLRFHGGYIQGDHFVFNSVIPLGLSFRQLVECQETPAPVVLLRDYLEKGGAAIIVMVDGRPGGTIEQHWVRLVEFTENGQDCLIMDPWPMLGDGQFTYLLERYALQGWDLARAIFRAVIYTPYAGLMESRAAMV